MNGRARTVMSQAARIVLLAVAVGVAAYGLYLLVVGQTWIVQGAVPLGEPPATAQVQTIPTPYGLIPLVGGALIVVGVAARRLIPAWIGAAIVTSFAAVFLFSIGGILLPIAPVLLGLLAIVTWDSSRRSRRRFDLTVCF